MGFYYSVPSVYRSMSTLTSALNHAMCYITSLHFYLIIQQDLVFSVKLLILPQSTSIKGCLPSKGVFHQRMYSIKGHLPSKLVFHKKLSSIKGRFPLKVVYHQWSSSFKISLCTKFPTFDFLSSDWFLCDSFWCFCKSAKTKSTSSLELP